MTERWLPVVGWEGLYEVSDQGRVRSLDRWVLNKTRRGRVLTPHLHPYGYVDLCRDATRMKTTVHSLVASAFLGPRPAGMEARHLDGNHLNNRVENLKWGTHSENMLDTVAHGTNVNANKTHCPQGHEYTEENTYTWRGRLVGRICRKCNRAAVARYKATRRAAAS